MQNVYKIAAHRRSRDQGSRKRCARRVSAGQSQWVSFSSCSACCCFFAYIHSHIDTYICVRTYASSKGSAAAEEDHTHTHVLYTSVYAFVCNRGSCEMDWTVNWHGITTQALGAAIWVSVGACVCVCDYTLKWVQILVGAFKYERVLNNRIRMGVLECIHIYTNE